MVRNIGLLMCSIGLLWFLLAFWSMYNLYGGMVQDNYRLMWKIFQGRDISWWHPVILVICVGFWNQNLDGLKFEGFVLEVDLAIFEIPSESSSLPMITCSNLMGSWYFPDGINVLKVSEDRLYETTISGVWLWWCYVQGYKLWILKTASDFGVLIFQDQYRQYSGMGSWLCQVQGRNFLMWKPVSYFEVMMCHFQNQNTRLWQPLEDQGQNLKIGPVNR